MSASRLVTDRSMPNIPMERFRKSPFDEEEIKIHNDSSKALERIITDYKTIEPQTRGRY